MHFWLEHLAVAVSAITGVMAAEGKRVDLFGILVLAVVTAFGGGTVRDLVLGSTPVFWVADPRYLLTATVVAIAWFYLARHVALPPTALLVADAGALALFTVVGARKAFAYQVDPSIAVAMGVITGVAGGILRDVLTGQIPLVFQREVKLYATASLAGAAVYAGLRAWVPLLAEQSQAIAIALILAIRLAAIRWGLSLPEFATGNGQNGQ